MSGEQGLPSMSEWMAVSVLAAIDVALWVMICRDARAVPAMRRLRRHVAPRTHDVRGLPTLWVRAGNPLLLAAVARLRPLASPARRARVTDRLAQAGLDWDPAALDALRMAGAAAGIAVIAVAGAHAALPGGAPAWMALAAALGSLVPPAWVRGRAGDRQRRFRRALPDALDVLAICLRAGLGLHAAIAEYVRCASGVAAEAFRRYLADLSLGRAPEEGLAELARRYPLDDLAMVSAALGQAMRLGSPLADLLEEQAAHCRALSLRRAQEEARVLSTRLVLPLVLFIFPQIFIIGLGPVALRLFGPAGVLRPS